jgi:hypothetical protein
VLLARHAFAPFAGPGSRMATVLSMLRCPQAWRTPSPARAAVSNVMNYLVSTFISRPWSARAESRRGGTGRGTGPRAGCSPRLLSAPFRGAMHVPVHALLNRQPKSLLTAGLRPRRPGGGLCRPLSLTCRGPRITGQPWRERPRVLAASAITSAAMAGRSRHGCLVFVDVRPLTFLRVDTTAKSWPLSAAVLSRSVQRNQRAMRSP